MTREDCLWVAWRVAGLALVVFSVIASPQLVTATYLYMQMPGEPLSFTANGETITLPIGQGRRIMLAQGILQVAIPGIIGLLFLVGGFRWHGGRGIGQSLGKIVRGEV